MYQVRYIQHSSYKTIAPARPSKEHDNSDEIANKRGKNHLVCFFQIRSRVREITVKT